MPVYCNTGQLGIDLLTNHTYTDRVYTGGSYPYLNGVQGSAYLLRIYTTPFNNMETVSFTYSYPSSPASGYYNLSSTSTCNGATIEGITTINVQASTTSTSTSTTSSESSTNSVSSGKL